MPNHLCWLCKANTGHQRIGEGRFVGPESGIPREKLACAAFECTICGGVSVGLADLRTPGRISVTLNELFDTVRGDEIRWRPKLTETTEYPNVPGHIGEAAREAYECHSNDHFRGAIMLARAVIEATAKDKKITTGTLFNKIEQLATAGLIRAIIKDAAHGVRELGNEMAHGDFVDPITAEESELVIQLMGQILNDVYQSPAVIAQAQKAAQSRKQGGQQ